MSTIHLKYGRGDLSFEYDDQAFTVLRDRTDERALTDAAIGSRFDAPIGSQPLEALISPGDSVLIVVPDATRQTGSGQIVNLLVRRLIANGTAAHDISVIFATGIHRKVTEQEKADILTPFIAQRIKAYDHDPRDLMQIVRAGQTSGGIPIELSRRLFEHDRVILVGGVSFHYFAGFTGGRKLICPGLASSRTVAETHKLAFDCEAYSRRGGVDTGLLDDNAVHKAFIEGAAFAKPAFAISTITDDNGSVVDMFCGDWIASHRAACDAYAAEHTLTIKEKRKLVIVSCGGYPLDINIIQAHKALDSAARACADGGTIILLAECEDGLGRDDLLTWFDEGTSDTIARRLCEKYKVNGQTAWALRRKTERFRVCAVSSLPNDVLSKMGIEKVGKISDLTTAQTTGYILPNGAKTLIVG